MVQLLWYHFETISFKPVLMHIDRDDKPLKNLKNEVLLDVGWMLCMKESSSYKDQGVGIFFLHIFLSVPVVRLLPSKQGLFYAVFVDQTMLRVDLTSTYFF